MEVVGKRKVRKVRGEGKQMLLKYFKSSALKSQLYLHFFFYTALIPFLFIPSHT